MPPNRETIQQECQQLKILKEKFLLKHADTIRDRMKISDEKLTEAKRSLARLKHERDLIDQKLWPFKEFPYTIFQEQYEFQRQTYEKVGILTRLSTREMGMTAIDGNEYPFPTMNEVSRIMRTDENTELLKNKLKQFHQPQCLIVPSGMKLGYMRNDPTDAKRYLYDGLIGIYAEHLRDHYTRGELYYTKAHPDDPFKPEDRINSKNKFDALQPIWICDQYNNADINGTLVYQVKAFDKDPSLHQGKTKTQLLQEQGGWTIIFTEDMPNIPRKDNGIEDNGIVTGGRSQIDTSGTSIQEDILDIYLTEDQQKQKQRGAIITPSPHDYLNVCRTESSVYKGENDLTPEADLIYSILYLEKNHQVINDYQGVGSMVYCLGAFFIASGGVPYGGWDRDGRRVGLYGDDPDDRGGYCGFRPAVSLKLPLRTHS